MKLLRIGKNSRSTKMLQPRVKKKTHTLRGTGLRITALNSKVQSVEIH